jgi:hypothetical protein
MDKNIDELPEYQLNYASTKVYDLSLSYDILPDLSIRPFLGVGFNIANITIRSGWANSADYEINQIIQGLYLNGEVKLHLKSLVFAAKYKKSLDNNSLSQSNFSIGWTGLFNWMRKSGITTY